ncbi:hypothetical protein ACFQH2_16240 [Natronoarchaeum sp. GCM10025703]|uniref:hypothetical protein n=1 Tax=Natronoarchaeum sp. GCM10025703 TaxID=3252685 RepID=UPI003623ED16
MVDDTEADESRSTGLTRRSWLAGAGGGGLLFGTLALLGRSSDLKASEDTLTPKPTGGFSVEDEPDVDDPNVVHLGEEGMKEGDDAGAWLSDYIDDGMEIIVPAGTYDYSTRAFTRGHGSGYADLVVRGEGEFGDVVFDHGDGYTFSEVIAANGGDVLVDNITWRGVADGNGNITARAHDGDEVTLRRVARPDGSNDNGEGVFVRPEHAGVVTLEDCWMEAFTDNGVYGSAPGGSSGNNGEVNVIGGLYRNNNIANIRVGGSNSTVDGATVVLTDQQREQWGSSRSVNMRGIWVREGTDGKGHDITIKNCDVYSELPYAPIEVNPRDGGGSGVIEDTRVYNEGDATAVGHLGGDWESDNLHITGDGDTSNDLGDGTGCRGLTCEKATPVAVEPVGEQ